MDVLYVLYITLSAEARGADDDQSSTWNMSIQQPIRKACGQTMQKLLSIVALAKGTLQSSASTTEAVHSVSLVL